MCGGTIRYTWTGKGGGRGGRQREEEEGDLLWKKKATTMDKIVANIAKMRIIMII